MFLPRFLNIREKLIQTMQLEILKDVSRPYGMASSSTPSCVPHIRHPRDLKNFNEKN